MRVFKFAVVHQDKEGSSFVSVTSNNMHNDMVLAKDEDSARMEIARNLPSEFPSDEVVILIQPFS